MTEGPPLPTSSHCDPLSLLFSAHVQPHYRNTAACENRTHSMWWSTSNPTVLFHRCYCSNPALHVLFCNSKSSSMCPQVQLDFIYWLSSLKGEKTVLFKSYLTFLTNVNRAVISSLLLKIKFQGSSKKGVSFLFWSPKELLMENSSKNQFFLMVWGTC